MARQSVSADVAQAVDPVETEEQAAAKDERITALVDETQHAGQQRFGEILY